MISTENKLYQSSQAGYNKTIQNSLVDKSLINFTIRYIQLIKTSL